MQGHYRHNRTVLGLYWTTKRVCSVNNKFRVFGHLPNSLADENFESQLEIVPSPKLSLVKYTKPTYGNQLTWVIIGHVLNKLVKYTHAHAFDLL